MNFVEEEDELDKLQLQTRDPFQLELIDAVKRRQKRETGFSDDLDKSTQRHSKAMDIKMSRYLSNKQLPFYTDNGKGESSSLTGSTGGTMYLGSTGGVNNTLATTSVHNSNWKQSSIIDSDGGDINGDVSTDDEDDIVIGSNARIPREDTNVTKKVSHDSETREHAKYGDFKGKSDVLTESGLNQTAGISSKIESENVKRSKPKKANIEPEDTVSSERQGIQRRKQFCKQEEHLEAKEAFSSVVSQETNKRSTDKGLDEVASMEMPASGRRRKFGAPVDSDNEMNLRNDRSMEGVQSISQRGSKIDDIFEYGIARNHDSLQHIGEGGRQMNRPKSRDEVSDYESPIEFGRKSGTQSPRSRPGSSKEFQVDSSKSAYKKSSSSNNGIRSVDTNSSNKAVSRSSSGRNTPEIGKSRSISGRSSPADGLLSSVSKELSKSESKVSSSKDAISRSRSGSGRSSEGHLLPSKPKEDTVANERPKSAKIRDESDRSKLPSRSGKNTPEIGEARSISGRSSPAGGLLSSVPKELSSSESKVSTTKDDKARSRSGSGRSSKSHLLLSQSKHETERPKSAKVREGSLEGGSRHLVKEPERRLFPSGSKGELKDGSRHGGAKQRSSSPETASKTSLNHRRSHSIGNSPREMEDSKSLAPRNDTFESRGRSKSDAMKSDDKHDSVTADTNRYEESRDGRDLNRLGNKYSLKRPGSIHSLTNKDAGSDSEDDDEEFIGIRRSSRMAQKESGAIDPRSQISDDRRATPSIKKPLRTELQTAEKSSSEEIGTPDADHGVNGRFNTTKSKDETLSKAGKDPLSKFKIKGRGEAPHSKTTPFKPNKDINLAQSNAGRSLKGAISSPSKKLNHASTKRSLSFTNISNIKPHSPYQEAGADSSRRGKSVFDSEMLREQIYYDWLQQKSTKTKQDVKDLRKREKEKEEEAEREKEDKKLMSQKAFEAWSADKEEGLKAKRSENKEKKLKEKEKQDEELQKKLDSKKHFESWKSNKEKELIEHMQKLKEEKREKRIKEFEDQEEKRNSSKKVYENWKSKKTELLKEKAKEKKEQEKQKKLEEIEKMEKKRKAEKLFETWKETKQKSPREKTVLTQRAWCPSGRNSQNTIPANVKPVVQRNPPNRARTLSATARLQNRTLNSTFNRT